MNPEAIVEEAFRAALTLRRRPSVAEWASRARMIVQGARAGPWDHARAPYLRGIMDAFNDPGVRRITIIKAEQVGGTEVIYNCLLWTIVHRPGPRLYVYPNADVARRVNKRRLLPTMRRCPEVGAMIGGERDAQGNLEVAFVDGSFLFFAGSNSEANLEAFAYRDVYIDEYDRCEPGVLGVVAGRGQTYPDHKIVVLGTPSDEDVGVAHLYAASDRRRWMTPCPACGEFHVKGSFSRVAWDHPPGSPLEADPETVKRTAVYRCPHCEHRITAHEHRQTSQRGVWAREGERVGRDGVVRRGENAAENAEARGENAEARRFTAESAEGGNGEGGGERAPFGDHAGFWIRGYDSTLSDNPFGRIAAEFVENRGRASRPWANRRLGEPWRVQGQGVKADELKRLRLPVGGGGYLLRTAPPWAVALTCAADVQGNRAVVEVRAWGERMEATGMVDWFELPLADGQGLRELDRLLTLRYPVAGDAQRTLPVGAVAVDSGFETDAVYVACERMRRAFVNVWPVKGDGSLATIDPLRVRTVGDVTGIGRHRQSRMPLLLIKTNVYKEVIADAVAAALADVGAGNVDGARRFALPADAPDEALVQLASETRVIEKERGQPVAVWRARPGYEGRNHTLDACVYNHALAVLVGLRTTTADDMDRRRGRLAAPGGG